MFCLKYCLTRRVLPHRITIISLFLLNLSTSGLTHVTALVKKGELIRVGEGAGTRYLWYR